MIGMHVRGNHCVELQDSVAKLRRLPHRILYQKFSYMTAATIPPDSIARICDMATSSDIVGVQDVDADDLMVHKSHGGILSLKERFSLIHRETLLLRKSLPVLHNLIPDRCCLPGITDLKFPDSNLLVQFSRF